MIASTFTLITSLPSRDRMYANAKIETQTSKGIDVPSTNTKTHSNGNE